MKRVFLYAYDKVNLGDDLFVHTIVKRYPKVQFYLWSSKENIRTFQELPNLHVIDADSKFLRILQKLRSSLSARYKAILEKRCEAVVYIGGSLFIEYDNWEQILSWWEYEATNRPFYVLGANFGPYKSEEYRKKLDNIFACMKDVCFRDTYSYEKFENNPQVRCASDILFSIEMPKVDYIKKQVFVSLIDLETKDEGQNKLSMYEEQYLNYMEHIVRDYAQRGYQVILSSFCKHEGDEKTIDKIKAMLGNDFGQQICELKYDGTNSKELLIAIAESEGVVTSRFHGVILGLAAGRPVFPVVYSDKTIHVLEDMGFTGAYADIRALQEAEPCVVRQEDVSVIAVDKLKISAQKHFAKLDEVLKE